MKEPNWKNCTEEDVWKYVGWHLAKNGIETILVGGAVAAIYSEGAYKSGPSPSAPPPRNIGDFRQLNGLPVKMSGFIGSSIVWYYELLANIPLCGIV